MGIRICNKKFRVYNTLTSAAAVATVFIFFPRAAWGAKLCPACQRSSLNLPINYNVCSYGVLSFFLAQVSSGFRGANKRLLHPEEYNIYNIKSWEKGSVADPT